MLGAILWINSGTWYSDLFVLGCGVAGAALLLWMIGSMVLQIWRVKKARIQREIEQRPDA